MTPTVRKFAFRLVIPIAIFLCALVIPAYPGGLDTGNFLTVVSFIFVILLGFFIATATTNYLNFQNYLGEESSSLIMLFNFSQLVQPSAKEKVAEAIDQYLIATLDFSLTEYVKKTSREFDEVIGVVDSLEPEDEEKRRAIALDHLHAAKNSFLKARQSITLTAQKVITSTHWSIIVLLTGILLYLLFDLRDGQLLSNIIVGFLSATLYLILLLLREVDGNVFLEEQLAYEDTQEIFRTIGRLSYFPAVAFRNGLIKEPKQSYRIGTYTDYPRSMRKEIKIVRVT